MELALLDLLAELGNLVFLPDIPDPRAANQQAEQKRLERWPKADRRRLIFSIPRHTISCLSVISSACITDHSIFSITRNCALRLRGFASISAALGRDRLALHPLQLRRARLAQLRHIHSSGECVIPRPRAPEILHDAIIQP